MEEPGILDIGEHYPRGRSQLPEGDRAAAQRPEDPVRGLRPDQRGHLLPQPGVPHHPEREARQHGRPVEDQRDAEHSLPKGGGGSCKW